MAGSLLRLNLTKSKELVGITSSRGTRAQNEDNYSSVTLEIPASEHARRMSREANRAYFGIFDGHGGPVVSEWLAKNLHQRIETTTLDEFPRILSKLRSYGGYFRRFKIPRVLADSVDERGHRLENISSSDLSLEQRLMLSFLDSDTECLQHLRSDAVDVHEAHEGSTGSVVIVEPHDDRPFWESERYDIVVGHVGDTRILLCDANTGEVVSLTTGDHHPSNSSEQERLRKYAGFITTDSWGDDRILGMLATSRAFGDAKLKKYGVSSEPDIARYTIDKKNPAAFMVLITDGVTSALSDQEVVDLVKQYRSPSTSAAQIIEVADQLGSEDNITAMVVRLKDWGTRMHDLTQDLRKYRLDNSTMSRRQSW
ncbi:hypothetical protein DFQ28_004115 [Apophysomyces sp. BC1034]|nr:hypothetical protein DFQ30_003203 [Apophysomyces sp. BC1015]KAG0179437.1 hypothetical protein DFQ29_002089 [Apophysomyces sp. BC1021]KAG0188964.1 hypothetical protein DFQ28_004115 [Apophysomyces sp. BC1034]